MFNINSAWSKMQDKSVNPISSHKTLTTPKVNTSIIMAGSDDDHHNVQHEVLYNNQGDNKDELDTESNPTVLSDEPTDCATTKRRQQTPSRRTALFLGFVTLAVIGVGLFLILKNTLVLSSSNSTNGSPISPTTSTNNQLITISSTEVALHSSSSDCWFIVYDGVYDVTSYAPNHPGGSGYITDWCGQDATNAFEKEHTQRILQLLPSNSQRGWWSNNNNQNDSSSSSTTTTSETVNTAPETSTTTTTTTDTTTTNNNDKNNNGSSGSSATTDTTATTTSCYTLADVLEHTTQVDCWYSMYGAVWDLTSYGM